MGSFDECAKACICMHRQTALAVASSEVALAPYDNNFTADCKECFVASTALANGVKPYNSI